MIFHFLVIHLSSFITLSLCSSLLIPFLNCLYSSCYSLPISVPLLLTLLSHRLYSSLLLLTFHPYCVALYSSPSSSVAIPLVVHSQSLFLSYSPSFHILFFLYCYSPFFHTLSSVFLFTHLTCLPPLPRPNEDRWHVDIESEQRNNIKSRLTILQVTLRDSGRYHCQLTKAGKDKVAEGNITLHVQGNDGLLLPVICGTFHPTIIVIILSVSLHKDVSTKKRLPRGIHLFTCKVMGCYFCLLFVVLFTPLLLLLLFQCRFTKYIT